jgi:hypothetical protein
MNSEERPATSRTAYRRTIKILCPRALSNHILHVFERGSEAQPGLSPSAATERNPVKHAKNAKASKKEDIRISTAFF